MEEIINKVALSSLVSLDLEEFYPQGKRIEYDLATNLYEGLVLREKDFRAFLKTHDWKYYENTHVAIKCSSDAIVPTWAYMLVAIHLEPYAKTIIFGDSTVLETELSRQMIANLDVEKYKDAKVVIKGCSKLPIPISAYVEISRILRPLVASLMFGEPCSTVPLYKRK